MYQLSIVGEWSIVGFVIYAMLWKPLFDLVLKVRADTELREMAYDFWCWQVWKLKGRARRALAQVISATCWPIGVSAHIEITCKWCGRGYDDEAAFARHNAFYHADQR